MKLNVRQLRALINEELRGVPLFAFREATRLYVDSVRKLLRNYVLVDKSPSAVVQKEAFEAVDEVLKELEVEMNALLEEKLYNFLQRI
jgi:hypothetical protein